MYKLLSCSIYGKEYREYNNLSILNSLKEEFSLDGFEISRYDEWDKNQTLPEGILGFHGKFTPIWLDFWSREEGALLRQFGNRKSISDFYGGEDPYSLIHQLRMELLGAEQENAAYMVFHVCHMELEHCYNYEFTYTNEQVTSAFIDLFNEALTGLDLHFPILFENTWWPGLTLLDSEIPNLLLKELRYNNIGFVLDIGHMMNSNPEITSEAQAIEWILLKLAELDKNILKRIKVMHLHSSLSGNYIKEVILKKQYMPKGDSFIERYIESFEHIGKIDCHQAFQNPDILKIIDMINPEFIVHEFTVHDEEELRERLKRQEITIGCTY